MVDSENVARGPLLGPAQIGDLSRRHRWILVALVAVRHDGGMDAVSLVGPAGQCAARMDVGIIGMGRDDQHALVLG